MQPTNVYILRNTMTSNESMHRYSLDDMLDFGQQAADRDRTEYVVLTVTGQQVARVIPQAVQS